MDITLCTNKKCPKREDCFRFKAVSTSEWQSYARFEPAEDGNCAFQMPLPSVPNERTSNFGQGFL